MKVGSGTGWDGKEIVEIAEERGIDTLEPPDQDVTVGGHAEGDGEVLVLAKGLVPAGSLPDDRRWRGNSAQVELKKDIICGEKYSFRFKGARFIVPLL